MGLVGTGQFALQAGDRIGEEEPDEGRERLQVFRLHHDVERLRFGPERREVEIAFAGRAIDGRIEPEFQPGSADHADIACPASSKPKREPHKATSMFSPTPRPRT